MWLAEELEKNKFSTDAMMYLIAAKFLVLNN